MPSDLGDVWFLERQNFAQALSGKLFVVAALFVGLMAGKMALGAPAAARGGFLVFFAMLAVILLAPFVSLVQIRVTSQHLVVRKGFFSTTVALEAIRKPKIVNAKLASRAIFLASGGAARGAAFIGEKGVAFGANGKRYIVVTMRPEDLLASLRRYAPR